MARNRFQMAAMVGAMFVAVLTSGAAAVAANDSLEYAVKAAYLYKFGDYIVWPESAFESPSSAVNVCLTGSDPFGDTLDKAVNGQRIGARPIVIRRLETVERNSGCQILYVSSTDQHAVEQTLGAVRGTPVLTVTDASQGVSTTGIVQFVIKDNRVRFTIDEQAASDSGLTISSKLLGVALSVKARS